MIEKLHEAGVRSEHAYLAGFASIGMSFLAWVTSLKAEKAGPDRADRWGIFVGHWAPTFFSLGNALRSYEKYRRPPPGAEAVTPPSFGMKISLMARRPGPTGPRPAWPSSAASAPPGTGTSASPAALLAAPGGPPMPATRTAARSASPRPSPDSASRPPGSPGRGRRLRRAASPALRT
jgi:hypothetical protein